MSSRKLGGNSTHAGHAIQVERYQRIFFHILVLNDVVCESSRSRNEPSMNDGHKSIAPHCSPCMQRTASQRPFVEFQFDLGL